VYSVVLLAAQVPGRPGHRAGPGPAHPQRAGRGGAGIGLALALLYLGSAQHPAGTRIGGTAGLVAATVAGLAACSGVAPAVAAHRAGRAGPER